MGGILNIVSPDLKLLRPILQKSSSRMKSTKVLLKFTQIYPKIHSLNEKTTSRPIRCNFEPVFSARIGPYDDGGELCGWKLLTGPLGSSMGSVFSIR